MRFCLFWTSGVLRSCHHFVGHGGVFRGVKKIFWSLPLACSRSCSDSFVAIFFFSFYLLNVLQSDNNNNNNNNTVHVLEHKYVLAFLVVILTLLRRLGLKLLSRPQNIFIPAKLKFYNWLAAHNLSLVLDTVMTFFLGINRVRKMVNIPWNFKSWLNNEDQTSVSLGQIGRLHILLRLELTRSIKRENR